MILPAGYYNPIEAQANIDSCLGCPAGLYCGGVGLSAPTGNCSEGFWCRGNSRYVYTLPLPLLTPLPLVLPLVLPRVLPLVLPRVLPLVLPRVLGWDDKNLMNASSLVNKLVFLSWSVWSKIFSVGLRPSRLRGFV